LGKGVGIKKKGEKMCFLKTKIGDTEMIIKKGEKEENDYVILFDGKKFSDKDLFKDMSEFEREEWNIFFQELNNNKYININEEKVETNFSLTLNEKKREEIEDLIKNIEEKGINNKLKKILVGTILRSDIDNINYPPPKLNGAKRHIVQIYGLYGYLYNDERFKYKKLSERIEKELEKAENFDIKREKIVNIISSIGYPNNKYKINTEDFFNYYKEIIQNKE
jgi:hypothetical protein